MALVVTSEVTAGQLCGVGLEKTVNIECPVLLGLKKSSGTTPVTNFGLEGRFIRSTDNCTMTRATK